MTTETAPCSAGYYCTGGSQVRNPSMNSGWGDICPKGSFCIEGSDWPEICAAGSYTDAEGMDVCLECQKVRFGNYNEYYYYSGLSILVIFVGS